MGISDRKHVNFSQSHELNNHLRKVKKPQTIKNRKTLKIMGRELKNQLSVRILTHQQFDEYILAQLQRLDD